MQREARLSPLLLKNSTNVLCSILSATHGAVVSPLLPLGKPRCDPRYIPDGANTCPEVFLSSRSTTTTQAASTAPQAVTGLGGVRWRRCQPRYR